MNPKNRQGSDREMNRDLDEQERRDRVESGRLDQGDMQRQDLDEGLDQHIKKDEQEEI